MDTKGIYVYIIRSAPKSRGSKNRSRKQMTKLNSAYMHRKSELVITYRQMHNPFFGMALSFNDLREVG